MIPTTSPDECGVPAQELLLFASGQSKGAPRRQILEHLLAGCARCRETLAALKDLDGETPTQAAREESEDAASVSRILASLGQRAQRIEKERAQARLYLADFLAHPAPRQWTLVRNSRRFDTWSFGAGLLEAAFESIYDDPRRSLDLALMAQTVVERLPVEPYGQRSVNDLVARALAHVGNARRALGDLAGAGEALARARQLLADGTGDPLEEAELLYYEASLLRGLRRIDEALRKVRRSSRLYRELGDAHLEGRSLMSEANLLRLRGEPARAIEVLSDASGKVDPARDPRLALGLRHNQAWNLMELGRTQEALDALDEFRTDYERLGDRTIVLRLAWLQGNLFQKAGRREEAESQFRAAVEGFTALELPYETASAALDYALLLAEERRFPEMREIAAETLVLFHSIGVARESIAAWTVFQQAAEAEAVTAALLERLARYYSEAKLRPELKFEG